MDVNFSTVGHLPTEERKGLNEDSHWDRQYIPELLRKYFWAELGRGGQTNVIHVSIILGLSIIICTHLSFQAFSFPPLNMQSFTFLLKNNFKNIFRIQSSVSHVTWLYYVSEAQIQLNIILKLTSSLKDNAVPL